MNFREICAFTVAILYTALQVEGFQYPLDEEPCILVNLNANITVKDLTDNKSESVYGIHDAKVTKGRCAGPNEICHLDIKLDDDVTGNLSFIFSRTDDYRVIMDLDFTFVPDVMFDNGDYNVVMIPDIESTMLSSDRASYTCEGVQDIEFEEEVSEEHVYIFSMSISHVAIQAFNLENGRFSPAQDCKLPTIPKPGSPDRNTYKVSYNNGRNCIMFVGGIQFSVPYATRNYPGQTSRKIIVIPSFGDGTIYSGNCTAENDTQNLIIQFYNGWKLKMIFSESSNTTYFLSFLELTAEMSTYLFPDILEPNTRIIKQTFHSNQFAASTAGSYKCNEDSKVTLNEGFEMDTYNLQYAAFQNNITAFPNSGITGCSNESSTHSVVPIAVGVTLALLAVNILIAYLIGRKRSRQSAYEQM